MGFENEADFDTKVVSSSSSSLRVEAARSRFFEVGVLMRIGFSFLGLRVALAFGALVGVDVGTAEGLEVLLNLSFSLGMPDEGVESDKGAGGFEVVVSLSFIVGRCDMLFEM